MLLNNLQITIATAYPDVQTVPSRKGRTFWGNLQTDQGVKRAYIKVLPIEEIVKEALCAVLGRKLHLPIKPVYYVSMANTAFHGRTGNSEDIAFGALDDMTPSFAFSQFPEQALAEWQALLRCAVFDEWIANRDRVPNNVRFERTGLYWLYDHDDALAGYLNPSTPVNPQLLAFMAKDKSEFELHKIRDETMRIVEQYQSIDWNEIRSYMQIDILPGGTAHLERYIKFLAARTGEMRDILTQDLGIRQKSLFIDIKNTPFDKTKHED